MFLLPAGVGGERRGKWEWEGKGEWEGMEKGRALKDEGSGEGEGR